MDQTSKRPRKEFDFDSHLCVRFSAIGKWLAKYFFVVLGCDTPILEALLYARCAFVGCRTDSDIAVLFDKVRQFMADRLQPAYRKILLSDEDNDEEVFESDKLPFIGMKIENIYWNGKPTKRFRMDRVLFTTGTLHFDLILDVDESVLIVRSIQSRERYYKIRWACFQKTLENEISEFLLPDPDGAA